MTDDRPGTGSTASNGGDPPSSSVGDDEAGRLSAVPTGNVLDADSVLRFATLQALTLGVLLGVTLWMLALPWRTFDTGLFGPVALFAHHVLTVVPWVLGGLVVATLGVGLAALQSNAGQVDRKRATVSIALSGLLVGGVLTGAVAGAAVGGVGGSATGLVEKYGLHTGIAVSYAFDYEPRGDDRGLLTIRMVAGDTMNEDNLGSVDNAVRIAGSGFTEVPGAALNDSGNWVAFDGAGDDPTLHSGDLITVGVESDCSISVMLWSMEAREGIPFDRYECPGGDGERNESVVDGGTDKSVADGRSD